MKSIVLNITKSSDIDALSNITGYTGRATEGGIDRLSATADEEKLTSDIYERSISKLSAVFNGYAPVITDSRVTISAPNNFNEDAKGDIEKEISSFLINNSCAEWFFIARNVDDATEYQRRAEVNYNNINNLLSRRIKPVL